MARLYAPLYEMLVRHAATDPASFHVPGHHGGQALRRSLQEDGELYEGMISRFLPIMNIDLTEISATDDLHHPEGAILEAQQLAARCFGAEETFFLVGGSTAGNLALLLAVCDPGDLIIVQRNVHKSIINGLKLAGASAVFLTPELDEASGLATVPTIGQMEQALMRYPEAKGVFLSNPNYYGMGVRLDSYADICHSHGKPLLVDEAHGAHYGFHPKLPVSAIAAGADGVVQSTHKTLPALTMGAMLHIQDERIDRERVRQSLAMVQSSSPSFPIMASLDISRAMIDCFGEELFRPSLEATDNFRQWLKERDLIIKAAEPGFRAAEDGQYDPFRLILRAAGGRLTGYELQRELERLGCWAEMSDPSYTVLIVGVHATAEALGRLKEALIEIDRRYSSSGPGSASEREESEWHADTVRTDPSLQGRRKLELSDPGEGGGIGLPVSFARDAMKGRVGQRVELALAEGMASAEMVVPYPPGIPLLYPGERITARVQDEIKRLALAGAKFQGAQDETMATIAVFSDHNG